MKNKGFTLVELLAIILLLSFLTIIVFPNLLGSFEAKEIEIDQATKDILYSSADQYMEKYGNDYDQQIGFIYDILISDIDNEGLIPVDVSKYLDKCIEVKIGNTNSYKIIECPDQSMVNLSPITSSAGVRQKGVKGIAYFNPSDIDEVCNEENSTEGSGKTGCMKWYIFDDSGSKYKMILDHNTDNGVVWNSSNSNVAYESSGAYTAIQNLNWDSSLNTTIITVKEINTITGKTGFDASNITSWYYLDSKNQTAGATSQGASQYAWLYNYMYNCKPNGCDIDLNNSAARGYWTNDTIGTPGSSSYVWVINLNGYLINEIAQYANYGVRPVITVPKNKFKKV